MLERFTNRARTVVVAAQTHARAQHATRVEAEHLLLGLLDDPDSLAMRCLVRLGSGAEDVRDAVRRQRTSALGSLDDGDLEALRAIGIDAEEVLRRVESDLGPLAEPTGTSRKHIPFSTDGKKALELALREAIALKHKYIGTEHLLLGLLRGQSGTVARTFTELDLTHDQVRDVVLDELRQTG
ncbi:Clp protease N-terminal domain-containing protein [Angustibacter luteus]|uniref:Clp protease N-terminal domain-containing protein n=1 Tax=Angustibacter luteus TaxID=658456 RepID=A0ABW1JK59_9ACTN